MEEKEILEKKMQIRDFILAHKDHGKIEFGEAQSFLGHRLSCSCGAVLCIYPPDNLSDDEWESYSIELEEYVSNLERILGITIASY